MQSAHQAYVDAQAKISQYRSEIESVQAQLTVAVDKLDQLQAELAQIQSQVAETKARLARAQARYERIRAQLGERAAQAFIAGPASDLEIFLGATSMDDLSDRMAFVDAVTQSDAALAQVANNLKVVLQIEERALQDLEAKQQKQVDEQTALRDQILHNLSYISSLRDQAVALAQHAGAVQDPGQAAAELPSSRRSRPCPAVARRAAATRVRQPVEGLSGRSAARSATGSVRPGTPGRSTSTPVTTSCRTTARRSGRRSTGSRSPPTTRSAATASTSTRRTAPTSTTRTSRGTRRSPAAQCRRAT